jgi:DNA (cytosine-5)-methyltransferase 1
MRLDTNKLRAIELFAGAGGLGLGIVRAGFHPALIVERDRWCCDTLRGNGALLGGDIPPPVEGDVRNIDFSGHAGDIDLVTGGPPCQPFSLGGKHRAHADHRDMWPEAVRVVRETRPRAFIFENVRGLARPSFADYLAYILLRLRHPSMSPRDDEDWNAHMSRLQRHQSGGASAEYRVVHQVLDAANYGVAQRRHRVFFVGFRADIEAGWRFPSRTHSSSALAREQLSGDYWDRHRVPKRDRVAPSLGPKDDDAMLPWATVRDALEGLPDPRSKTAARWPDHKFQDGARIYDGHTGSFVDQPAKALKAGVHGVPGGENMLRLADGSVRYFTIREAARLQTFPDHWRFRGSWSEAMRQLGNAVPATLAHVVASSVLRHLEASSSRGARVQ